MLLESKIPLTTLTIKKDVSLLSSNGERSNLKDVFLNILYSQGEPTPHSQMEIYHGWRNGIKCTAYRTLTYNAYEYTTWHLLGDMTLSQILSICAIGQVSLFAVLNLAYNALRGDWVLQDDTCLYEYNIYAHYTKNMKINNAVWYTASRTVFWKGYSGSKDDEVRLMGDTKHFAYDDNPQLIDLAFNSYFGE